MELLSGLNSRKEYFDVEHTLRLLLIDFLEIKLNAELIRGLCAEALNLFGNQLATIVNASEITLDYIANGMVKARLCYKDKTPI